MGASRARNEARAKIKDPRRKKDWADNNPEWTAVFSVFLSQLAESSDYVQEWNWSKRKIDLAWFLPKTSKPTVLFEVENQTEGIDKKKPAGEAIKLARTLKWCGQRRLAVLITYPWGKRGKQTSEGIQGRVTKVLKRYAVPSGQFLLVLGADWHGRVWTGFEWKGRAFERI
jgi:hypothetical protein